MGEHAGPTVTCERCQKADADRPPAPPTRLANWRKLQWVGETGVSEPGSVSASRSASSLLASTPDRRALHRPGPAALRPAADSRKQVRQGQVALVRRPREPLRGHAADPFAAADVHLVAARRIVAGIQNINLGHDADLHDGRRRPFLQPSTRHGNLVHSLSSNGGRCGELPWKGAADRDTGQGECFPFETRQNIVAPASYWRGWRLRAIERLQTLGHVGQLQRPFLSREGCLGNDWRVAPRFEFRLSTDLSRQTGSSRFSKTDIALALGRHAARTNGFTPHGSLQPCRPVRCATAFRLAPGVLARDPK